MLGSVHDQLQALCGAAKVLNDPTRSLLRYDLLRALHERGINRFNVYRLSEGALPRRFPVFVRREHGHRDPLSPLLRTAAEYAAAVAELGAGPGSLADNIVVEFCDTADDTGLYRKYSAFIVGERIIPRHVFFSRSWMVKMPELAEPSMLAEERAFLEGDTHADALREIFRLARVSYGRIDYSLLDGRPQTWEINTNPMLVSGPDEPVPGRRAIHLRFVEMAAAAFAAFGGEAA